MGERVSSQVRVLPLRWRGEDVYRRAVLPDGGDPRDRDVGEGMVLACGRRIARGTSTGNRAPPQWQYRYAPDEARTRSALIRSNACLHQPYLLLARSWQHCYQVGVTRYSASARGKTYHYWSPIVPVAHSSFR